MNIAIVCDGVGDVVGGGFISALRFGELLRGRGHRVIFIAGRSRVHPSDHEAGGIKSYRLPSVLIPRTEGQLYLGVPFPKTLRRVLRTEEIDIVHVMIPMPLGLVTLRVAKTQGIPVVMHSHFQPEIVFMSVPQLPYRDALMQRFLAYLNWLYGQADAIVYPSAFARRQFPKLSTVRNVVISNGVDGQTFRPIDPDAFKRRFNLSTSKRHLMYLGRLHPEKNVETLIRAMPIIVKAQPHTHLFIVGFGFEQPALEQLARECGVAGDITFCGYVPDEDIVGAYSACDLFVFPSLAELEGMAVLQAMACGKPLLVADAKGSAAPDLVEDNGLLFTAQNAEHLAEQAGRLLSDAAQLRAMGEASRLMSRRYDIHASIETLESVYRSLLHRPV